MSDLKFCTCSFNIIVKKIRFVDVQISKTDFNCLLHLGGGVSNTLIVKKFVKKTANAINEFLQVLLKSSCKTFKTIFETLSALRAFHVTIIGG